jgi:hypothetical protein
MLSFVEEDKCYNIGLNKVEKDTQLQNVHKLFTYEEASAIAIITRINRKDDGNCQQLRKKIFILG